MMQCDYWAFTGKFEWCELSDGACNCRGNEKHCSARSKESFLSREEHREPPQTPQHKPRRHRESGIDRF